MDSGGDPGSTVRLWTCVETGRPCFLADQLGGSREFLNPDTGHLFSYPVSFS